MNLLRRLGWRELWLATVALAVAGYAFNTGHTQQPDAMRAALGADNEYSLGGVLFHQTAAEYRALSYQAYNLARQRFDLDGKQNKKNKTPRAVVVDADETVIDNSPYQAMLAKTRQAYAADTWQAWCAKAEAKPLPGALEFLQYAHSKGARVFYVTNRRQEEKACTAENLRKMGFPDVTDETLLVRADTSSKEPRRQAIAQKRRIVLLIGDNLNDLAQVFERKPIAERKAAVDTLQAEFGTRFIVLPNAMYGDWESAVYGYQNGLGDAEKRILRTNALQGY
jgi:5'-nucleotidase (lipoprotein e(P4) family)